MKTNVGYSVVKEFIIQHKDMTSIAEALGILKERWDMEGIKIGNFMIDCQQSEENAIDVVCSQKVLLICAASIGCLLGCDGLLILRME